MNVKKLKFFCSLASIAIILFIAVLPNKADAQFRENLSLHLSYEKPRFRVEGELSNLVRGYSSEIKIRGTNGFSAGIQYKVGRIGPLDASTGLKYSLFQYNEKRCDHPWWNDECFPSYRDNFVAQTNLHYLTLPFNVSYSQKFVSDIKTNISVGLYGKVLMHTNDPVIFPQLVNFSDRVDPDNPLIKSDPQYMEYLSRSHIADSLSTLTAGVALGLGTRILKFNDVEVGLNVTYSLDLTDNFQSVQNLSMRKRSFEFGLQVSI